METHLSKTLQFASEAGIIDPRDAFSEEHVQAVLQDLKAFEALVRADEREALGVLETDAHYIFNNPPGETSQDVRDVIEWYSASIRARGNT